MFQLLCHVDRLRLLLRGVHRGGWFSPGADALCLDLGFEEKHGGKINAFDGVGDGGSHSLDDERAGSRDCG